MNIIEYRLITSSLNQNLNDMIDEMIQEGWYVYGNPCVNIAYDTHNREDFHRYSQAMVRYETE